VPSRARSATPRPTTQRSKPVQARIASPCSHSLTRQAVFEHRRGPLRGLVFVSGSERGQNRRRSSGLGLRLAEAVKLDYLLLDFGGDVRHDVRVEEAVVLLFRLPHLGYAEALGILIRDVEDEARLLLDLLDQRRRDLVVLGRGESRRRGGESGQALPICLHRQRRNDLYTCGAPFGTELEDPAESGSELGGSIAGVLSLRLVRLHPRAHPRFAGSPSAGCHAQDAGPVRRLLL
jgi:hypothetical protein